MQTTAQKESIGQSGAQEERSKKRKNVRGVIESLAVLAPRMLLDEMLSTRQLVLAAFHPLARGTTLGIASVALMVAEK